jgi:hypothetical protein
MSQLAAPASPNIRVFTQSGSKADLEGMSASGAKRTFVERSTSEKCQIGSARAVFDHLVGGTRSLTCATEDPIRRPGWRMSRITERWTTVRRKGGLQDAHLSLRSLAELCDFRAGHQGEVGGLLSS